MTNMNLNPGGILCGLLGAGIAVYLMFTTGDGEGGRRQGRGLFLVFVVGGAFAGNFVWNLIFPGATVTDANADGRNDYTGKRLEPLEPLGDYDADIDD